MSQSTENNSLTVDRARQDAFEFLSGGGEMGALIRAKDWKPTPLGAPESWPQSLRTAVGLCLSSTFPILIAWGPETIQIYNDSYRPICGEKHPESLGQNFRICWETALPVVGDAFTRGQQGEGTYIRDQRMFLDRYGYLEEAFMTFSFTPIRDEAGQVGGIFHPITETTDKMLSARRTQALRDLSGALAPAKSNEDIFGSLRKAQGMMVADVPFLLYYAYDGHAAAAELKAVIGMAEGGLLAPKTVPLDEGAAWPLAEALQDKRSLTVSQLAARFGSFGAAPYPEPPDSALIQLIRVAGREEPVGFLVSGVSARRALDAEYLTFYELLNNAVDTAFSNVYAFEEERKRIEALAELDRAKTIFFSNISHEFRTPLTLMLGPLEEAVQHSEPLPEPLKAHLDVAYRNTLRLQKLVNTLLEFSRLEAGRIKASYRPVDVCTMTTDLASTFRAAIEKAGMTLHVYCERSQVLVYLDPDMWEKIVLNLLSNAFKYTERGSISVLLTIDKEHFQLEVADTGIGIAADHLEKIFERFHRVENVGGRSGEGTGIGLALVKELVKLQGGTITVRSELHKGSVFVLEMPLGHSHLPLDHIEHTQPLYHRSNGSAVSDAHRQEALNWADTSISEYSAGAPDNAHATGGEASERIKILVADDNADMREYITRLLSPAYDVIAAADGEKAFEAALSKKPDLILSDVMMPRLDGFGLLAKLKSHQDMQNIPLIFLSARAGEEATIEGLARGASDYLIKPFSARELIAKVDAQIVARRKVEENERQLEQKVRERTVELRRSNEDLQQFAHVASHDLKEPIRKVKVFAERLGIESGERLNDTEKRYLERIQAAADRMLKMVEGVLAFSRFDAMEQAVTKVNLRVLINTIADDLDVLIQETRTEIRIEGDSVVEAAPVLMYQLFYNLIINSIKFSKAGQPPVITVEAKKAGDKVVIRFKDEGIGFPESESENIFITFKRLHPKDHYEGTGLGLSLCKKVVERHGGTITASGRFGKGAEFFISLPLEQAEKHL